jgi:phosphoglycolate phosphatase
MPGVHQEKRVLLMSRGSVIFDYDGTLVDSAGAFLEAVNTALLNAGLGVAARREISSTDLRTVIAERAGNGMSASSREQVFDSIWTTFAKSLSAYFPLRDGAGDTLRLLNDRGFGLALVSKRSGRAGLLPLKELRSAGLESLFRFVKVGVSLPEYSAVLSLAIEALKGRAQETFVVSDWCKDIVSAKHMGLRTIGILGGLSDEDEHKKAGADWVVKSLDAIPKILNALDLNE